MTPEATEQPGTLQTDSVWVRTMREDDLEAVVSIDAMATGRRRPHYFELMLEQAVKQAALKISLSAELDGHLVGFLVGSLYYGEFGVVEPAASIEAIGVDPGYRGRHVGKALLRQLRLNLGTLGIRTVRTEVAWDDFELLAFFKREGFSLADCLCLECRLDPTLPVHNGGE